MVYKGLDCDFCGKIRPFIASTPHGCFCKDCFQLMIEEFNDAITEIEVEETQKDAEV